MTYHGSCHCGAVTFEADFDLRDGTFKCNCEMCTKTRMWGVIIKPESFRLISGAGDLVDYRPDNIHHVFCRHCGVRPYGFNEGNSPEEAFYGVRLSVIDDLDPQELPVAPIQFFDGHNDRYDRAPAFTAHL